MITDALRQYIERRLGVLGRYASSLEKNGELVLYVEIARTTQHHKKGEVYYVECTLTLPKKVLRIEQYHSNVRTGVDEAQRRMKQVLEDYKEKVCSRTVRGERVSRLK